MMISAMEALDMSGHTKEQQDNAQIRAKMDELDSCIRVAAVEGRTYVYTFMDKLSRGARKETISKLYHLGYTVKWRCFGMYLIKWDKPKVFML